MLNIYGNRSIIPNNYYFTFDKIYASESELQNGGGSDAVLIGRMALAKAESTVWLKTVNGYQKVAKLDNEGRFLYLEGYDLETYEDIDDLRSQGNTLNGDGTYIVKNTWGTYPYPVNKQGEPYYKNENGLTKDKYAVASRIQTDIADFELDSAGTTLQGITTGTTTRTYYSSASSTTATTSYNEGNIYYKTINPYAANSTFVLNQYSNEVENLSFTAAGTYYNGVSTLSDAIVGNLLTWQNGEIVAASSSAIRSSASNYDLLNGATVRVYQIITDITNHNDSGVGDNINKMDDDDNRENLSHKNKTFIRKGKFTYALSNAVSRDSATTYYTFDSSNYKFQQDTTTNIPYNVGHLFTRTVEWGDWQDVSEQYIGYIGDLNPDYDYELEDGVTRNRSGLTTKTQDNLASSSDLVDAINTLDFLIGGRGKISGNRTTVNKDINGGYDSKLKDDERPYSIPEDNIMDVIVHHDADIGPIENQTALNNVAFSRTSDTSGITLANTSEALNTYSLTNMIKVLDRIIGAYYTVGKETYTDTDTRPNHLSKSQDITTNLRHLAADLGEIEELNLNNVTFNSSEPTNVDLSTFNSSDLNTFNVQSLVDIIEVLDEIIGRYQDIDSDTYENRTNHLKEYGDDDLVTTLKHLAADLGQIEKLTDLNNVLYTDAASKDTTDKSLSENVDNDKQLDYYYAESLINIIRALDTIIGNYKDVNEDLDSRPNHISDTSTITENLQHLAVDIGIIENYKSSGLNNMLYLITGGKDVSTTLKAINNNPYSVLSLMDAIVVLDKIIGKQQTIDNNYDNRPTNYLDDDESIVDNIKHIGTDLGSIEDDLADAQNNIVFTSDSTRKNTDPVNGVVNVQSVVQALIALDAALGKLSSFNTTNTLKTNATDIVSAINYLDTNVLGEIRNIGISVNNLSNYKTVRDLIERLNDLIGNLSSISSNDYNGLNSATNLTALIKYLDNTVIGDLTSVADESANELYNGQTIATYIQTLANYIGLILGNNNEGITLEDDNTTDDGIKPTYTDLVSAIKALDSNKMGKQTFEELVEMVNNLGQNMDILDVTLKALLDNTGGSSSATLEWGTF